MAKSMTSRYAIYASPQPDSPLAVFANSWLGRDPDSGLPLQQPSVSGLTPGQVQARTADPRLYGFHATLKPPFRLAKGYDPAALDLALETFARSRAPVPVPPLRLAQLGNFIALVPGEVSDAVQALAADCVMDFDRFRSPADAEELTRRRAKGLTPAQDANLQNWGYPYVLDEFRLHYTLTGRLDDAIEKDALWRFLSAATAPVTVMPLAIDSLCLFVQPDAGTPFRVARRYALGG